MVIALDIDGTITRNIPFFRFLSRALAAEGHQVVIITYRCARQSTVEDLKLWGITYSRLFCAPPDLIGDAYFTWKGDICRCLGVEVFFEDDPGTLRAVDGRTLCMMPIDRSKHDLEKVERKPEWMER